MTTRRSKLKFAVPLLLAFALLLLGTISSDQIVLTASCGGYGTRKTEKAIPFALDGAPFRLSWWQTFKPTAIRSFHLNFHTPATAHPVLQVGVPDKPELFSYPIVINPHPDQGGYPASDYGFADGANVALNDAGILRYSGVELFLTERENREFLCSDSEFKLAGDRENIIASTVKTVLTPIRDLLK